MRKKLVALFFAVTAMLAFTCTALAAKPPIELMDFEFDMNSVGGVAPTVYYRNNSGKTIKYLEWYITAYNRVGDLAPDEITGNATMRLRVIGPIAPFQLDRTPDGDVMTSGSSDSPFYKYYNSGYWIDNGGDRESVYQDAHGNYFIRPDFFDSSKNIYLTEDEINNALFTNYCDFDIAWYNSTIDYLTVKKVVITYMDGSTQTVTDVGSSYRNKQVQNKPFMEQVAQYEAVYNYRNYMQYNQDLAGVLGDDQKAWFEHFINSGMKEGRQGNAEFNLAAYKANNPDLVALFGDDNAKYYEHYIAGGKAEGRKAA